MPGLDRIRLLDMFVALGEHLQSPATICLIGSVPGIASGQQERSTQDIDVWRRASDFDTGHFMKACAAAGLLFDPRDDVDPAAIYVQIVQPGIVEMPADFPVETIGRFGNLTVTMPSPELLCAAKLVRASDSDIEDVVWWVQQRALTKQQIAAAIEALPGRASEAAAENLIFIELLMKPDGAR